MAQITTTATCYLDEPVQVQYIKGNVFSQDNMANIIKVSVFATKGGSASSLSGSVSATVIRSDGGTVAINGTFSSNVATIILPQAAYAVPGTISIIVKNTVSSTVTTIAALVTVVYRSSTDTVVDPGTIIPSVQTLITEIETAIASIPADYSDLWESLAPAYSTSRKYAVDDYCTYDGGLYRCVTAITTPESWTAAHWAAVTVGEDISRLTSAVDHKDNLASNMPDLPYERSTTSSSAQATVFNSYSQLGAHYVKMLASKVYFTIFKIYIYSDDTSTAGTLRLSITKKDTSSTEPATVISRKDVNLATAAKGSVQYIYNIATVTADTSVYYKLISYSSGTTSRAYHMRIDTICALEFDTEQEATDWVPVHRYEITPKGWFSAIDYIARHDIDLINAHDAEQDISINKISEAETNLAGGMPNLPFTRSSTTSDAQYTLYNSYASSSSSYYTALQTGKYYLIAIKFDILSDDTSTAGTVQVVPTKKDTASTEPVTAISLKNVNLATAPKGSSQYVYLIGTVSAAASVYYKLVSYSSGTSSRYFHMDITGIITVEFDTQAEAEAFASQIPNTDANGWRSAIDLIARADRSADDETARERINILSQVPYTGKTCCVIGDSLSASYYDMWVSYFAAKTGATVTNSAVGGTTVAVRSGRTDSFVERISAITTAYDLWIIFGGMNDKDDVPVGTMSDTSTSIFYGAYKSILANLMTRENHPIVVCITPYHNVDAVMPYVEAIREVTAAYGVPLVDLAKISGVNPTTRSIYTRDATHPNQLLCDRIRPQITRELVDKIVFPVSTDPMPH